MGTTYYLRWSSKCLLLEGWPRWALGCCAWLGGSPCIRTSFWHRFRRRSKQFLRFWTGWRRTTQTHTETQTTESKLPPQSLETRLSSSTGISSIQPLVMTCLLEERPQHQTLATNLVHFSVEAVSTNQPLKKKQHKQNQGTIPPSGMPAFTACFLLAYVFDFPEASVKM